MPCPEGELPVDGRFRLTQLLGQGGQGQAYRALDLSTGDQVVVKLLSTREAVTGEVLERFRREILALERLRHPNVVELVAQGTCPARDRPYYAMAWVEGEALSRVLARAGPLGLPRGLRLADQVLAALEAAHALGVAHRDLKPDNLLLERPDSPDERVRVIDFGLSRHQTGGDRTRQELTAGKAIGTPHYMAPEQAQGLPSGPPADVYAVGCLLMTLLTGKPPFTKGGVLALLKQHVHESPPRLDERLSDAPQALTDLVASCLHKRPDQRPSVTALRSALSALPGWEPVRSGRGDAETLPPRHACLTLALPPDDGLGDATTLLPADDALGAARTVVPGDDGLGEVVTLLPASEDALRGRLEVEVQGQRGQLFLFAGPRLRFGRNRQAPGQPRENDLLLRSFPRSAREDPALVMERTRRVSGHHGTLLLTPDGVALVDDGSRHGLCLDGRPLPANTPVPLGPEWNLDVAGAIGLRGRVYEAPPGSAHPVAAVRLDRTRDGEAHAYLWVIGEASVGSGADDPLSLPEGAGVSPRQALLAVRGGQFQLRSAVAAATSLTPGTEVRLGQANFRFGSVDDDDMIPAKARA